jgi:ribose transport system substrate-binding protein
MLTRIDRRTGWLFVTVLLLGALVIAGCGGGSSSSSSSSSAETTKSESESETETANGEGEAGGEGESSALLAEAEKVVQEHMKTPKLGITEPIKKSIPSGKLVEFVTCAPAACLEQPEAFAVAADVLGWKSMTIVAGTSPEELQNAMEQTIKDHADGVIYSGLPASIISRQLAQLKEEKVPVVGIGVTEPANDPPNFMNLPGGPHYEEVGEEGGALAASNIEPGSDVLMLNFPELPVYTEDYVPALEEGLKHFCPTCTTEKLDIKLEAVGKDAPAQIVAYLQGHTDVDAVYAPSENMFIGLPAALKGASISDVKLFGMYPVAATLPYVAAEEVLGTVQVSYPETAWIAADAFARAFAGENPEVSVQAGTPTKILTAENLESTSELLPALPDYKEEFENLWGK